MRADIGDFRSGESRFTLLGAKDSDAGNRISLLNLNPAENLCHCIGRDRVGMVMAGLGVRIQHQADVSGGCFGDRN